MEIIREERAAEDRERASLGPLFSMLPSDMFLEIFSFLRYNEVGPLKAVCRFWRRTTDDEMLWKVAFLLVLTTVQTLFATSGLSYLKLVGDRMTSWKYVVLYAHQLRVLEEYVCFWNKTNSEEDVLGMPLQFFNK